MMNIRKFNGKPLVFTRASVSNETDDTQRLSVILSSENVASDGHVIVQNGWDLSRYRGALLWEHNRAGWMGGSGSAPLPPIGRVEDLEVVTSEDGPILKGWIRFFDELDPETGLRKYPLAYQLAEQYRGGFITDVSVGFVMLETQPRSELPADHRWSGKWGLVSRKTMLLELSAVIFGADQAAMVDPDEDDPAEAEEGRDLQAALLTAETVSFERGEDGEVIIRVRQRADPGESGEDGEDQAPIPCPEDEDDPQARALNEDEDLIWSPALASDPEAPPWFPGSV